MLKICLSIEKKDAAFDNMQRRLSESADVTVADLENYTLRDVDIFIGKKMNADKLREANRLKAVFAYKTGVEDFPLAELAQKGVVLANSHADSDYIAQYAFALALCITSRVADFDRNMRNGDWCAKNPCWDSLFGMRVGLVGYGSIGRQINEILKDNHIESYTLNRGKNYADVKTVDTLDELCKDCDMLILSLPSTAETDGMFNEKIFSLLSGKYIVNVGRSNCIDEHALYDALSHGTLKGAAIDTWREKPKNAEQRLLPFDDPFHKLPNVVLSSHKAMQVSDGHARYVADVLQNVTDFIKTGEIRNAVDLKKGY